eukprot:s617_g9.t1
MGALFGKDTGPNSAGNLASSAHPWFSYASAGRGGLPGGALVPAAVAAVLGSKISAQQQLDALDDATAGLPEGSCGNMTQGYLKNIQGDKNRHCYWGNPDLTPGDFPDPPPQNRRQGAGGYGYGGGGGGYGGGYGNGAAAPAGYAAGAAGAAGAGAAGAAYGAAGQGPPFPSTVTGAKGGGKGWHGEPGQRWKAGAPPQKRSVENVLPEAPVTGPPEHIEKIDPYPPVPSPKEEANSAAAKFLFGTTGMAIGAAGYLI